MPQTRTTIAILTITLIALIGLGAALVLQTPQQPNVVTSGKAEIGGPFSLITHDGRAVTEKDFYGQPTLVFFGFTYCPDICPLTLELISATLNALGPLADDIQPLFISVDPERDTPEVMADYIQHFDERIVGLTGSVEAVQQVTAAYRVYVQKKPLEGSADYLVDHTSLIYLMDAEGHYLAHYADLFTAEQIAQKITQILGK